MPVNHARFFPSSMAMLDLSSNLGRSSLLRRNCAIRLLWMYVACIFFGRNGDEIESCKMPLIAESANFTAHYRPDALNCSHTPSSFFRLKRQLTSANFVFLILWILIVPFRLILPPLQRKRWACPGRHYVMDSSVFLEDALCIVQKPMYSISKF